MKFFKLKLNFRNRAYDRGQATVEYILLITVVIAIALGIGGPLGRQLSRFSGAMLGPDGYYGCLTREGLLPGQEAGVCGSYAAAGQGHLESLSSGEAFSSDWSAGGALAGSGDSEAEDGEAGGARPPSLHRARGSGSSARAGAGNPGGSGAFDEGSSVFSADGASLDKSKKRRFKKKKRYPAVAGGKFDNEKKAKKRTESAIQVENSGEFLVERPEGEESEENEPVFKLGAPDKKNQPAESTEQKKGLISDRKPAEDSELKVEDKGLNISGFIKYLVIIAIIVAIIMIVFSQIMEYQSRD